MFTYVILIKKKGGKLEITNQMKTRKYVRVLARLYMTEIALKSIIVRQPDNKWLNKTNKALPV